jgi:hypothetical protein
MMLFLAVREDFCESRTLEVPVHYLEAPSEQVS